MSICDSDQARKAAENRRNFPQAAALLDDLRAEFGPQVKLVWANENGAEIGRKSPGPFFPIFPHESAASIKKRLK